jgi:hypothetical protein
MDALFVRGMCKHRHLGTLRCRQEGASTPSPSSPTFRHSSFCFGGGLYVDPVFPNYQVRAIVARQPRTDETALCAVDQPPPNAIDYYGMVDAAGPTKPAPGDSVVFGFRPQAFVTRAFAAGVSGLSVEKPVVESVSHSSGAEARWPR